MRNRMKPPIASVLALIAVVVAILLSGCDEAEVEIAVATQVATNIEAVERSHAVATGQTAMRPTEPPTVITTPVTCMLQPEDQAYPIGNEYPTAMAVFRACFGSCIEAAGGTIDPAVFNAWLEKNSHGDATDIDGDGYNDPQDLQEGENLACCRVLKAVWEG